MQKATKLLLLITLYFICTMSVFGQTPNFSGTWTLNFEKSKLEERDNGLTGNIFIIKQEGAKFHLKIYHIYYSKKKKISFKMVADGKTRLVKIIFKGKLENQDNSLLATLWRKNFLNIVQYSFGNTENEFVADETFTGKPQNHHNIWVFDRVVKK